MHEVKYLQDVEFPSVLIVPEEERYDGCWIFGGGWPVEQPDRAVRGEHEYEVADDVEQQYDHRVILPLWIFGDELDHEVMHCVGVQQREHHR